MSRAESNTVLAEIHLDPKEIELLIDRADDDSQRVPVKEAFDEKESSFEVKGFFEVDLRRSKPTYEFGALEYGPIKAKLYIERFKVIIDWHKSLGIPKKICVTLFRAYGKKIEICQKIDLGVSKFDLIRRLSITNALYPKILDLSFHNENDHYALHGDVSIVSALIQVFITGWVEGAIDNARSHVERELRRLLGNGEIARAIIKIIIEVLNIISIFIKVLRKIIRLASQPIDELLHKIFGKHIEVPLGLKIPKNLPIMEKENGHNTVYLKLNRAPKVSLNRNGLSIKIVE